MMIRLNKSSERERGGSSKKIAPIDENTFGKNSPISDEVKFEFVPHTAMYLFWSSSPVSYN